MAGRRVVRTDRPALDEGVRDDVGTAGERDGSRQRFGRGVGVRARVQQDLRLDLHQAAFGVRVVAVAQQGRVAVGVAEEGLLAGRGQLDRAAGLQREQTERELEAGVLAVAGRAGHSGHHDLDPVGLQAEAGGGQVAVGVRVGGRGVDLDTAVGPGHGEPGLGADGRRVLAADPVEALDDDLAGDVRVAEPQRDVADQIAVGVQRFGLERLLRVGDRLQHLVLDRDGGRGEPGGVRMVGGDRGDGLAVVADQFGREDGAVGDRASVRGVAGDVGVRDHRVDAGHRGRLGRVDGEDPGVRVRGAQYGGPEKALGPQVGRVGEGALGLRAGVGRREGRAEPVRGLLLLRAVRLRGLRGGRGGRVAAHAMPPSCCCGLSGCILPEPGAAWCGIRASSDAAPASARPATTSPTASSTPR